MKINKKQEKEITNDNNGDEEVFQAIVSSINNKQIQVFIDGKTIPCMMPCSPTSLKYAPVVGDAIEMSSAGNNQYRLVRILPRRTVLYRGDRRSPGNKVLIAANVQYLLAIVTAEYLINQAGFPEAAMIASRRAGISVGLFISKWDLLGERAQELLRDKLALYQGIADSIFLGSVDETNEKLIQAIRGKTTVVIGDRNCGKSTLIQRILSELQENETICENIPGTHSSRLHAAPEETLLIDTPGFRDFALPNITEEERSSVFPEIAQMIGKCRFSDCSHVHEEGCQVIEALRKGRIKKERYHAYIKMADATSGSASRKSAVPRVDYRHSACTESFVCKVCGTLVVPDNAGSQHRNHCPKCLSSVHVDEEPGDRSSLCRGIMDPVSVWVRKNGEWAIIHRCRLCGTFSSNRIAADDNPILLMSIAVRPLSMPAFPLNDLSTL